METTDEIDPGTRCRLVLIVDQDVAHACSDSAFRIILAAGDVASIVFSPEQSPEQLDETAFQKSIAPLVSVAQEMGIAAIVAQDTRTAGRVNADGLQLGQDVDVLREAIAKFAPKQMVGAANVKTRHNALVIGELQPDYIMFGKPGGDIRAEPHPKNVALGGWWSSIVEIPCIVLGGTDIESVIEVAKCGAEFVAMGNAIFTPEEGVINATDTATRVEQVNELLDKHAPPFEVPEN